MLYQTNWDVLLTSDPRKQLHGASIHNRGILTLTYYLSLLYTRLLLCFDRVKTYLSVKPIFTFSDFSK